MGSAVRGHIGPRAHQSIHGHIGAWAYQAVGTSTRGRINTWEHRCVALTSAVCSFRASTRHWTWLQTGSYWPCIKRFWTRSHRRAFYCMAAELFRSPSVHPKWRQSTQNGIAHVGCRISRRSISPLFIYRSISNGHQRTPKDTSDGLWEDYPLRHSEYCFECSRRQL